MTVTTLEAPVGEAGPGPVNQPANPVNQPAQPASAGGGVDLFSDARSGFWAGVTAFFCVAIVAAGNLVLLAAAIGQAGFQPARWSVLHAAIWGVIVGVSVGGVVVLLGLAFAARRDARPQWVVLGIAALISSAATGVFVALLYLIAWQSAVSDDKKSIAWQPVVGFTMSVVAVASFGGYYLASRRCRVGFAASFVSTFLVLLSFMLTLDGLARVADGNGDQALGAASAVKDLLTDFRGSVALIVAFYFGTDAAVSIVKMIKSGSNDPHAIARLDRDIATPAPAARAD